MGGLRAPAQGLGRLRVDRLKCLLKPACNFCKAASEAGFEQDSQQEFYKCFFFVYSIVVAFGVEETSETLKVF